MLKMAKYFLAVIYCQYAFFSPPFLGGQSIILCGLLTSIVKYTVQNHYDVFEQPPLLS